MTAAAIRQDTVQAAAAVVLYYRTDTWTDENGGTGYTDYMLSFQTSSNGAPYHDEPAGGDSLWPSESGDTWDWEPGAGSSGDGVYAVTGTAAHWENWGPKILFGIPVEPPQATIWDQIVPPKKDSLDQSLFPGGIGESSYAMQRVDGSHIPIPVVTYGDDGPIVFSVGLEVPLHRHEWVISVAAPALPVGATNVKLCVKAKSGEIDHWVSNLTLSTGVTPPAVTCTESDDDGVWRMDWPHAQQIMPWSPGLTNAVSLAAPGVSPERAFGLPDGYAGGMRITAATPTITGLKIWREYDYMNVKPRSRVTHFSNA